jgi:hypothetical protein
MPALARRADFGFCASFSLLSVADLQLFTPSLPFLESRHSERMPETPYRCDQRVADGARWVAAERQRSEVKDCGGLSTSATPPNWQWPVPVTLGIHVSNSKYELACQLGMLQGSRTAVV